MKLEGVDLNLFLVLHHVLAEGSVSGAARRLHVTSSAVSNALARLRRLLGDPLLVRNGRTLVATPRARELEPQIAAAIERLQQVLDARDELVPERCTRAFTLASADHIGVLSGITARFHQLLPRATLRVVTLDHAVAGEGLSSGDIDILLGLPPSLPREYRSAPAYTDRLICGLGSNNPATKGKFTLDRFLACRHVEVALHGKHSIDYVDRILSGLGRSRDVALSVPQFAMAAMCVLETPYIAMLPESMALQMASVLPLALREPPFAVPPITILQVWHARTDLDPACALVRRIVREAGDYRRARPTRRAQASTVARAARPSRS